MPDTLAPPRRGHPRHQLRPFTMTASYAGGGRVRLTVEAQTEHDAILRAGIELGRRHPDTDPDLWHIGPVTDPAPYTWTPEGGDR